MFVEMGGVTLKSGENVSMGVVVGPELEWADRVERMLRHKGEPWVWQNSALLRRDTGVEAYFYVLHRDGRPFANIMTVERNGVGILGHVWTEPEDRRKGASTILMRAQMEDFRRRGGRALFLQTVYDTAPYHIYRGFGFEGIEPGSDFMAWYAESEERFDAEWFAEGPCVVEAPAWIHWPTTPALFMADWPGTVRCAPLGLSGRMSSEAGLLKLLHEAGVEGASPRASVLRSTETNATVGLAAWGEAPLWPDRIVVDVWCHPRFWGRAGELLESLTLPEGKRRVAFCDPACPAKRGALEEAGYREAGVLRDWVAVDAARSRHTDVVAMVRT